MNYSQIYTSLILKAATESRNKSAGYFENHHILPKSLGGTNASKNLVLLTAKEHYIAHMLLVEMYPKGTFEWQKMIYAASMFLAKSKYHNRIQTSSRFYEQIKKALSELKTGIPRTKETVDKIKATKAANPRKLTEVEKRIASDRMKGTSNPMYGKTHTSEVKEYLSTLKKGSKAPQVSTSNRNRLGKQLSYTKQIDQFTVDGQYVATYISIAEAKRCTGVRSIIGVLRGRWTTAGGYIWKYK